MSRVDEIAAFDQACSAMFAAATAAIENGDEWQPLLILDLKDRVGVGILLVESSMVPAIRAVRSSSPDVHPVEVAIVMDVWMGDPGGDVRPREDPASRSILMVLRQKTDGACTLGREYWVADDGGVTWAEEQVHESGVGGAVVDELADWVRDEVAS